MKSSFSHYILQSLSPPLIKDLTKAGIALDRDVNTSSLSDYFHIWFPLCLLGITEEGFIILVFSGVLIKEIQLYFS